MLAGRCAMLAGRYAMLADSYAMLAGRYAVLAGRCLFMPRWFGGKGREYLRPGLLSPAEDVSYGKLKEVQCLRYEASVSVSVLSEMTSLIYIF